ncbi:Uncharacterised protein [Acinetobacter baumannii]|nr:Uncharacterised protein [Acinetobacter baumannii]
MPVATSASPIGPATTSILALPECAMACKAWIIPKTVPNSPMKGALLPIDASKAEPFSSWRRSDKICLRKWRSSKS